MQCMFIALCATISSSIYCEQMQKRGGPILEPTVGLDLDPSTAGMSSPLPTVHWYSKMPVAKHLTNGVPSARLANSKASHRWHSVCIGCQEQSISPMAFRLHGFVARVLTIIQASAVGEPESCSASPSRSLTASAVRACIRPQPSTVP